jgi:hypothetical protein
MEIKKRGRKKPLYSVSGADNSILLLKIRVI